MSAGFYFYLALRKFNCLWMLALLLSVTSLVLVFAYVQVRPAEAQSLEDLYAEHGKVLEELRGLKNIVDNPDRYSAKQVTYANEQRLQLISRRDNLRAAIKEMGGSVPTEEVTPGTARATLEGQTAEVVVRLEPASSLNPRPAHRIDEEENKLNDLIGELERRLFDHLVEERENWDLKSATQWGARREELAQQLVDAEEAFAVDVARPITAEEARGLIEARDLLTRAAKTRGLAAEARQRFEEAARILEQWQQTNAAVSKAGGFGGIGSTALAAGEHRAWYDAFTARAKEWRLSREVNALVGQAYQLQEKVRRSQVDRGIRGINERLRRDGIDGEFRIHQVESLTGTGVDSSEIRALLGAEGERVLLQQAACRRRAVRDVGH